jgi:transposase
MPKIFGQKATDLLLINTIAPFLFVYGKVRDDEVYTSRSLALLEEVSPEENNIILNWKHLGIAPSSAFMTQALLQLRNNYCKNYRCLDCAVGHRILTKTH